MSERASRGGDLATLAIVLACVPIAWSAASGPHLFDAGELVAAGAQLGAGHPPGQPLHALLAHAAVLLPLGPLGWRVALLSVLFGGLAARIAAGIVLDALARRADPAPRAMVVLPAVVGLAVLLTPAVAPQLGRPEVYTLALALTLSGARALIAWACRDERASRALRVAALAAGLAVAVHPPHALALLAIGLVLLIGWRRDVARRARALAWAAAACVCGIGVIVYLPARAAAGAPMWGDATTAAGLLAYLSGSAYAGNLGTGSGSVLGHALEVIAYVMVPGALGAVLAIIAARARGTQPEERRRVGVIGAAAVAAIAGACLQPLERANPDNIAYAAPAMALLVALGGVALTTARGARAWVAGASAIGLLVSPLPFTDLRAAFHADLPQLEPLAFAIVDGPPPRALVVARSDFTAAAWLQARAVDGARPDVALLIEGLSTSSWHWETLAGHPLFDGTPVRSGPGTGHAPWVRGAIERALGHVAVVVESDATVQGRGTVLGPYLLLAPGTSDARDGRAFAERTFGASGRMLAWAPQSFGGLGHGVVRDAEIVRARRLFARDRATLAISGLRRAASPLDAEATREAEGVSGSPHRPPPPVVRDPRAIFATDEDAVRELAALLASMGEPARAARMLAAQQARGDDRALLQLAWMQAEDGLLGPARAALESYLAQHPDRADETAGLAARLR